MTDEPSIPAPPPSPEDSAPAAESATPPDGPSAGEAWVDVVAKLRDLGDAIGAWTKAATDTPENRARVGEIRKGVDDIALQVNEAFTSVAASDFGRQVSQGATNVGQAIGDTAEEIGQAAAPHVASAFAGLADAFSRAAHKVGEAATPQPAPQAPEAPKTPPEASEVEDAPTDPSE
jgi:hypothetical protein